MAKSQARVAAGKRAWNKLPAAVKQKRLAALARGRAKTGRSPGTKSHSVAKYRGKHLPSDKRGVAVGSKHVGIGKTYQGLRLAAAVGSPITEGVGVGIFQNIAVGKRVMDYINQIKHDPVPYAASLGVMAVDTLIDTKLRQTAAMSRKSITAIGPEFIPMIDAWYAYHNASGSAAEKATKANIAWNRAVSGYDPRTNTWDIQRTKNYRLAKHGGQAFRLARSRIKIVKKITDMLPLKLLGLTW